MADLVARRHVLYWCLGLDDARFDALEQDAYVASPCVRSRFGCPAVVSGTLRRSSAMEDVDGCLGIDPVGNVFACSLYSLGRLCGPLSRSLIVALAWGPRCRPGCRSWNDSASGMRHHSRRKAIYSYNTSLDAITPPRVRDTRPRSDDWFGVCHGRTCDGAERDRAWDGVPQRRHLGFLAGYLGQSDGLCAVLDCAHLPDRHCARVFLVLPQGTTGYVVSFFVVGDG